MSKPEDTPFTSLDAAQLEAVSGGDDAALTAAITSINNSLSSLKTRNNNTGLNITMLLPFMMMARRGGGCVGGNCG
jgi:hypothetical protein